MTTESEEPKTIVKKITQESLVKIKSTTKMVVSDEETNKIPKSEKTQQKISFKIN